MKVILLLLVAASAVLAREIPTQELTAYGYHVKYGIPEAERIRKAEEKYLNSPELRIVGGSPSSIGQFPYQAGIIIDFANNGGNSMCGGSLISANRIATAAHCWFDGYSQAVKFTVVLGSIFIFNGGTRIETSDVVMHPQWNTFAIRNDVAVIRLPYPVSLSANIATIALPSGDEVKNDFVGQTGVASGFGLTSSPGSISSNQFLSHVELSVISNDVCRVTFPNNIEPSNICTSGEGGKSICSSDSGGPLAILSNNKPVLIGITSFGSSSGCSAGHPSAYARVSSYLDFFNQNM